MRINCLLDWRFLSPTLHAIKLQLICEISVSYVGCTMHIKLTNLYGSIYIKLVEHAFYFTAFFKSCKLKIFP